MRGASAVLSREGFNAQRLLPPRQALIAFFSRASLLAPRVEFVDLDAALGRILARNVISDRAYPQAPRSTMDGYAIRSSDVPAALRVVGEVHMGEVPSITLSARQTVRIPTGGLLPDGADAVVPIENVRVDDDRVRVEERIDAGDCVTQRGGDLKEGDVILCAGRRIAPPEIGVLATLGQARVEVFARPRIAVISSGDELVDVAEIAGPAQIRDSNRYVIAAALRAMGATVRQYPSVRDDEGALEALLGSALQANDAIVLSGGSSVGERDRTPATIANLGTPGVIVHGLRVKPGKPTVLAAIGGKPIVGLPGNPTSALMILETVGAPIVAALSGDATARMLLEADLLQPIESRSGWTSFIPVALSARGERYEAVPLAMRSSLASLCARADGFITVDEVTERLAAGATVRVHQFTKGWLS